MEMYALYLEFPAELVPRETWIHINFRIFKQPQTDLQLLPDDSGSKRPCGVSVWQLTYLDRSTSSVISD